jgi:SAM-dependent methyltransferase
VKEPVLEAFLRRMRLRKVMPYVKRHKSCVVLDIGCGWDASLLREVEPFVARGIGIDWKAPALKTGKLETRAVMLDKSLPFADDSIDVVTMLAVLEHLVDPVAIIAEAARVLRPGGTLLLTVPSWYAKPVLEFLAFRMGVVSRKEIEDHKRYFNREDLFALVGQIPQLRIEHHAYFQWRFNNFCAISKSA